MVCIRCQKRPAIIFIQRMENGQMKQEGYCLHCARELHIKPVDDLMKQFGMSEQDLDNMENRMESMMEELGDSNPLSMLMNMSGAGEDADAENMDEDLVPGSNATFPLGFTGTEKQDGEKKADRKNGKKPPKRKFLDTYCENLTRKAREGKLDDIIGRDREIYRTIQILSRRQKNNPCLIGEAGVGKTAIAEGIAERIAKGQVPIGLRDKEIFLLDLTSLVAGTQFRGQFEQRFVLFRGAPFDFLADFVKTALVAKFRGQRHVTLGAGTELLVEKLLLRVARGLHQGGQRHALQADAAGDDRKPAEPDRKKVHQQQGDEKVRQRVADKARRADHVIGRRVLLHRRPDPERDRDQHGQQYGNGRQQKRGRQLGDEG